MGENKPLSQSEIDAMLSQLSPKGAPPAKSQTRTSGVSAPSSKPSEPVSRAPAMASTAAPVANKMTEIKNTFKRIYENKLSKFTCDYKVLYDLEPEFDTFLNNFSRA